MYRWRGQTTGEDKIDGRPMNVINMLKFDCLVTHCITLICIRQLVILRIVITMSA